MNPNTRRSRSGWTQGAWRLPQTTSASLRIAEHAPMQYDGGTTHTPQSLHVPHCTLRATNGIEHRNHTSPQQTTENTRKPPSLYPTQPRKQLLHMSLDQMTVTRSEREITAHMTHGTCQTRHGTRTACRLHTREGGDTNPSPKIPIPNKKHIDCWTKGKNPSGAPQSQAYGSSKTQRQQREEEKGPDYCTTRGEGNHSPQDAQDLPIYDS